MDAKARGSRPENCFRCWHCRRVEGSSAFCICMVNVTKSEKPEFITEPYAGVCPSFEDKSIQEALAKIALREEHGEE